MTPADLTALASAAYGRTMEDEMNPFHDAHETSLSKLSEHDWHVLSARWARGADWCIHKLGSRWLILDLFGHFPLFRTKTAAHDMLSNLICAEARWRKHQEWEAEHVTR